MIEEFYKYRNYFKLLLELQISLMLFQEINTKIVT